MRCSEENWVTISTRTIGENARVTSVKVPFLSREGANVEQRAVGRFGLDEGNSTC
jgi:hypothetical protein